MPDRRRIGLFAGLAAFALLLVLPPPSGLAPGGWHTAAMASLMAIWWLSEAIPIAATSLVPLVVLPLVGGGSIGEAAAPYANPIIFLFMGGFLIALAMERWQLHRRIALLVLSRVGSRPAAIIGGFMAATAALSMWVSNSAVALLMMPIGLSVVGLVESARAGAGVAEGDSAGSGDGASRPRPGFAVALMLAIAYSANIGGMGTLVGTPPNAFLAGFLAETHGIEVGFAEWMAIGLPLVLVSLPLVFLILTRLIARLEPGSVPGAHELIESEMKELGRISRPEVRVAAVFVLAAVFWIFRPLFARVVPGLSDAGIAIGCGLLLFLVPSGRARGGLLDWETAERLPWGVLILFGGGLSLATAIDRTGLNVWLGGAAAGLSDWPPVLFILLVTALVVMLTELTSNTATAAAFLPVLGAAAVQVGWDPRLLAVPAALAASCAFMLPIATPPNAVVYGSGRVSIPEMARAGLWVNLVMTLLITALTVLLLPIAFGVAIP